MEKNKTAVEWLAEKYNYLAWMRSRDEISASLAVEWLENFLEEAKKMEKEEKERCWIAALEYGLKVLKTDENANSKEAFEQYYTQPYESNKMDDAKSMMSESQPDCLGAVRRSFTQGDKVKIETEDFGTIYGEFHRYGASRYGAIIFVDGVMRFVDEQSLNDA